MDRLTGLLHGAGWLVDGLMNVSPAHGHGLMNVVVVPHGSRRAQVVAAGTAGPGARTPRRRCGQRLAQGADICFRNPL